MHGENSKKTSDHDQASEKRNYNGEHQEKNLQPLQVPAISRACNLPSTNEQEEDHVCDFCAQGAGTARSQGQE